MSKQSVGTTKMINITELLESILLELPPKLILTKATRVSKAWNDLIKTSPRISFHLSIPTTLRQPILAPVAHSNPSLQLDIPIYTTAFMSGPTTLGCRTPYPITRMHRTNDTTIMSARRTISNLAGDIFADAEALGRVDGGTASWKKMYATSPPCSTVQVRVYVSGEAWDARPLWLSDEWSVRASVRRTGGVTLGDVEAVATEMVRGCWKVGKHAKVVKMFRVLEELGREG
ncbi:hypothetical protein Tdes44962_MAKER03308 [Teratosphaeria destructans]|uniref:F-box domain-containing protein n=1 Tax=Teratosphaeria destructans TaxID=418781 RepID=A0A9W7W1V4_9PEZI|nr:hypothetical protein Tdes44962_MAKER03308 [Teratosphaeria destructans]